MIPSTDESVDASQTDAIPSNHHITDSNHHLHDFHNNGTSAATATTTNSSCNTNTTSFTNSSSMMIRNRPSTTTAAMPLISTSSTSDVETPQVVPQWKSNINTDLNFNKGITHRNNGSSYSSHPMNTTNPSPNNDKDNGNNINDSNATRYPVREIQFYIRGLQDPIVINPMVSLYAIVLLWSVVIWTIGTLFFALFWRIHNKSVSV